MGLYLKLAWRNIWRNKRRSLISISSILLAVVIALVTRSMQLGFYRHSINNAVSFYMGFLQIHAPGYFENQSIDRSYEISDSLFEILERVPHVTTAAPRLESFALASCGDVTDGVMVIGTDPARESQLTGLEKRVKKGRYLQPDDDGVLLAQGLADHLGVGVGDTIVLLGQGYHAVTAAGKYIIIGIVEFPTLEMNTRMIFMPLRLAQDFLAAENRITSMAVMIDKEPELAAVVARLKSELGEKFDVLSWEDMLPELVQYVQSDNASGIIMLAILYMVIGFGILGTILMMTLERTREFGMLMAVGMRRGVLRGIVVTESILLSLIGALVGMIAGIPVILYLHQHPIYLGGEWADAMQRWGFDPILPFATDASIFFWQGLSVLIIALIASLYPL
ncbi:MAG: ABC transporter permease, partial [Calditrichaeota bacterium]|nr:ABC transporter permease [Calditrichota bacterium]